MPCGNELIFGIYATSDASKLMLKKLKLRLCFDIDDIPENEEEDDYVEGDDTGLNPAERLNEINAVLTQAFIASLKRMKFTNIKIKPDNKYSLQYYCAKTPLGDRDFNPFNLQLYYDPSEMGDTEETAIIGVSISGRYVPTFADWKSAHGTLDPIVFDQELAKMQEIAKEEILKAVPEMVDCGWIVKMQWY